jgi:hypothetical protein
MHVVLMTREPEASGHHSRFPPPPPQVFSFTLKKILRLLEKILGSNPTTKVSLLRHVCVLLMEGIVIMLREATRY